MRVFKTRDVKLPNRATPGSAGYDMFIPNDMEWETKTIWPQEAIKVDSGIKFRVPEGFMLQANNKSGVAVKKGLIVGAIIIDSDYTGVVSIHLINISDKPVTIEKGEKIIQVILIPVSLQSIEEFKNEDEMYEGLKTERGSGGFGSTGTK